jgi:myo-inositol-1(or 4)-monophosphatase
MSEVAVLADIGQLKGVAADILLKLGKASLSFYGKGREHPPFDEGLVTMAELHLNDAFQRELESRFPNHLIFGRTTLNFDDGYTHGDSRYLWVFDPLDGVDNFQTGIPIWGMSLALYENHWPVLGLFYMPVTGDLFEATAGESAYWNDRLISLTDNGDFSQESLILTFSRFHQSYACRFPGKVRALGSTGAHICYVAMGRADAAIIANESFKDLAAVRVIVESAGGKLVTLGGDDFFLGDYVDGRRIEDHLIITRPTNVSVLSDYLTRM